MGFSKSKYTSGLQCPKILWLQRNMPDAYDEKLVGASVMDQGTEVGLLAQSYYGEPDLICDAADLTKAERETREAIEAFLSEWRDVPYDQRLKGKELIICEATFIYEGSLCMVDILRVKPWGQLCLTEVKSAGEVKPYYLDDASFQAWVVERCGYGIPWVEILHVNTKYVRHGAVDLKEMFTNVNVTKECINKSHHVDAVVNELKEYASQPEEPVVAPGCQCYSPHKCGYFGHCCLRHLPDDNVFDLAGTSWKTGLKYVEQGVKTMSDALAKKTLKGLKLAQATSWKGSKPYVDGKALDEHLGKYFFPVYHLDFETVMPAVPLFDEVSPYQQIPTQYSIHVQHADGTLDHKEYLADPSKDWRRDLAESLCRDIPKGACTVAYNKVFERGRIQELAYLFPDLSEHLLCIVRDAKASASKGAADWKVEQAKEMKRLAKEWGSDGLVDLMTLFKAGAYYVPAMGGSYSIKYVLPALFPDSEELNYGNLKSVDPDYPELVVRKGDKAAEIFKHILEYPEYEQEVIRKNLLQYCELDTFACAKVLEKLFETAGRPLG